MRDAGTVPARNDGGDSPDPHIVAPDRAPTPFTADEIRRGCATGRTVTVQVREGDAPPRIEVTRFVRTDERGATIEKTVYGEMGKQEVYESTATWDQLQAHAAFDIDATSVTEETLVSGLGALVCLRYRVSSTEGVTDFWFARDLPGMPIRLRAPGLELDVVENTG